MYLEALPAQFEETELKCMVVALYFNQYKSDSLGLISLLWDSKYWHWELLLKLPRFLASECKLWVSCVIFHFFHLSVRWPLLNLSCDPGKGWEMMAVLHRSWEGNELCCALDAVCHDLQSKGLNQIHSQATAWLQDSWKLKTGELCAGSFTGEQMVTG